MKKFNKSLLCAFTAAALSTTALPAVAETIDLLVLYDDYSNTYYNQQPATAMRSWVDSVNTYYRDSGVQLTLRLVGVERHNIGREGVLGKVASSTWVQQRRDALGADFVTQLQQDMNCGVGYVSVSADSAFNVVGPHCGPLALAHELGHNMGLNHSRKQGSDGGRVYRYGLGHGVENVFGTIMTYAWLYNGEWLSRFSNPDKLCKGLPCGVPEGHPNEADARKAMNNVRAQLAAFRPTKVGGGTGAVANGVYQLRAKHSSLCVDVQAASKADGAAVLQWTCSTSNNQRWQLTNLSNGYYEVKAAHSGKCLDVAGGSTSNGGVVHQWACHRANNQQWQVQRLAEDGSYRFIARSSGLVLDVSGASRNNGAKLHQWGWTGGDNQKWLLQRI